LVLCQRLHRAILRWMEQLCHRPVTPHPWVIQLPKGLQGAHVISPASLAVSPLTACPVGSKVALGVIGLEGTDLLVSLFCQIEWPYTSPCLGSEV
jgi:hypothetical protein